MESRRRSPRLARTTPRLDLDSTAGAASDDEGRSLACLLAEGHIVGFRTRLRIVAWFENVDVGPLIRRTCGPPGGVAGRLQVSVNGGSKRSCSLRQAQKRVGRRGFCARRRPYAAAKARKQPFRPGAAERLAVPSVGGSFGSGLSCRHRGGRSISVRQF
jgi:hypothetical protein